MPIQKTKIGLLFESENSITLSYDHAFKLLRSVQNKCKVCYLADIDHNTYKTYLHALIGDEKIRIYLVNHTPKKQMLCFAECTINEFLTAIK